MIALRLASCQYQGINSEEATMLLHKPTIGEKLTCEPKAVGANFPSFELTVTKFDGTVMHYARQDGDHGQIIWKFQDGLNQCLSHGEAA